MLKKIRYLPVVLAVAVMLLSPVRVYAVGGSSGIVVGETSSSFADEGGDLYDDLKEDIAREFEAIEGGGGGKGLTEEDNILEYDWARKVWVYVFHFYDSFSSIYPMIMIFSTLIGVVGACVATKNKKRRRFCICFLCIVVPVISSFFELYLPSLYLKFR